ncbi:hypothetical protein TNCV_595541 [Trichonephila clavipes]|nr:hypothetical protein TNCV_595541 [Trichonephila clavipes]
MVMVSGERSPGIESRLSFSIICLRKCVELLEQNFARCKIKTDDLKLVAEEIGLTVPRDAKMFYLKRLLEESDVFKEDYEFVKTVIEQVVEKTKLRNSAANCEIPLNTCDTETSIDEDMELPQRTEDLPLKAVFGQC